MANQVDHTAQLRRRLRALILAVRSAEVVAYQTGSHTVAQRLYGVHAALSVCLELLQHTPDAKAPPAP